MPALLGPRTPPKSPLQRYSDREMAADAELAAIRDEDPVINLKGRACERYMQWMMAYPDRHADDITTREQLDEAVCDVNAWRPNGFRGGPSYSETEWRA
jgi:hypothetical protein